ncbi:HD domain-containing protein [bacterium]|nr:HD domain-containing protein [bacterium]
MAEKMKEEFLDRDVIKLFGLMAVMIEKNVPEFAGHSFRVSVFAHALGKKLNLSNFDLKVLKLTCFLHDVGKSVVGSELFEKARRLTPEDFKKVKKHVSDLFGPFKRIRGIEPVAEAILQHHERYDGMGYPNKVKGEQISIMSRIVSVVDAFDSICNINILDRESEDFIELAMGELLKGKEIQFDPFIVDAFIDLIKSGKIKRMNENLNRRLTPTSRLDTFLELDDKYCRIRN